MADRTGTTDRNVGTREGERAAVGPEVPMTCGIACVMQSRPSALTSVKVVGRNETSCVRACTGRARRAKGDRGAGVSVEYALRAKETDGPGQGMHRLKGLVLGSWNIGRRNARSGESSKATSGKVLATMDGDLHGGPKMKWYSR